MTLCLLSVLYKFPLQINTDIMQYCDASIKYLYLIAMDVTSLSLDTNKF